MKEDMHKMIILCNFFYRESKNKQNPIMQLEVGS
jgi:hypothetical protein